MLVCSYPDLFLDMTKAKIENGLREELESISSATYEWIWVVLAGSAANSTLYSEGKHLGSSSQLVHSRGLLRGEKI